MAVWVEEPEPRLLSEAVINAIADLGVSGSLRYEEDVQPALAAAGIPEVPFRDILGGAGAVFIPGVREHMHASLSALDLNTSDAVDKVLRFTTRLINVYAAGTDADMSKIVRLRYALADDGYDLNVADEGMAGFSINKREIARMMKEIQTEFDKHPIHVPVNADPSLPPTGGTTVYHGPVIHGDVNGAQLAWNNQTVNQSQQSQSQQIAPGFEAIAQAVAKTLEGLSAVGLSEVDRAEAEEAAQEALTEVTQDEPDRGLIRRAVRALKGVLAPIAAGLQAGVEAEAQEWAKTAIEQLGTMF